MRSKHSKSTSAAPFTCSTAGSGAASALLPPAEGPFASYMPQALTGADAGNCDGSTMRAISPVAPTAIR